MKDSFSTIFDNSSLEKLSLAHETPFFLFSKQKIIDKLHKFKKCFPGSIIHYAMKANSEPEVLKILFDTGSSFEVASKYELDLLKAIKIPPDKIVYGTSVKPASHIKEFYNYGVDRFAFDSFSELEKISANAPGSRVYVRTIANDSGSVFKFSEKFGIEKENIIPLLKRAVELGLKPYGISFHVGSQASNLKAWGNALELLRPIVEKLKKEDINIEVINIGGGFPCNSYASSGQIFSLEEIAEFTLKQYKKFPPHLKLMLEPGRGIIADTSVLITSVIAKIERKERTWIFLDAGVYNALFEAMAYQGSTRYKINSLRLSNDSGEAMFSLAGPTGDSPDIIAREVLLPKDVEIGDKLLIHDVGAYTLTASSRFNGFPKPPVYFV
ncbi:MAG: type III PLP-dependent enzyme [Patescibacteria group bacterium]